MRPTKQKHAIGTQFLSSSNHPRLCTVTDFITVTNLAGEIVNTYYQSEHQLMGQTIKNHEVSHCTVDRGIFRLSQTIVVDASK